ncbi:AmmeMemoRadiSam system radical SAM enzyme [bacterium]|nr:AmmeMemoRadiSam system radical SAM enzyme [bacterium]
MSLPARWYELQKDGRISCQLCPRFCLLREGQRGFCFIRRVEAGRLVTDGYGAATGFALDPIEKKPLYHVLPGSSVFSFGTAGCNLGCKFCQNWTTSKSSDTQRRHQRLPAKTLIKMAQESGATAIAYTYNEPTIFAEYVTEVAAAARRSGILNLMVTNGYINLPAAREVYRHIDAANVDLKGFSDQFYRRLTLARLQPVLDFLSWLRRETTVWIEITTLLIEDYNDDPAEIQQLARWIKDNLGPQTPLHLTSFHPDYRMAQHRRTSLKTVLRSREIALQEGLYHVYTGNVIHADSQHTSCPGCGQRVIEREYMALRRNLLRAGHCPVCDLEVGGIFAAAETTDS